MSDTPRTDAKIIRSNLDEVADDCVGASFARELERENAKLRAAIDEAHTLGLAAKVMLRKGGGEYVARGNLANALAVYDAAQQRAINRSVT